MKYIKDSMLEMFQFHVWNTSGKNITAIQAAAKLEEAARNGVCCPTNHIVGCHDCAYNKVCPLFEAAAKLVDSSIVKEVL